MVLGTHHRRLLVVPLAWIGGVWGLANFTPVLQAGPPRNVEAEDEVVPASFADSPLPRSISPRTKSEPPVGKTGSTPKKPVSSVPLWGTVVGLCFVVSLFLASRAWLNRHGPPGWRGLPAEALELLGKRVLEPRVSIYLVRCGPKILMLGVGPDGVRALSEVTDPIEVDLLAGACRPKNADVPSFSRLFRRVESTIGRAGREDV